MPDDVKNDQVGVNEEVIISEEVFQTANRNGFNNGLSRQLQCNGMILLFHKGVGVDLAAYKILKLEGMAYPNLSRRHLQSRNVIDVEVQGNCCWKSFSRPFFAGNALVLSQGFTGQPSDQPKSIRKAQNC